MNSFQILLASNTNAKKNMDEACARLRRIFPTDIRFSDSVESMAINKAGETVPEGGLYLNKLCLARTELPLDRVQALLKAQEREMGRIKGPIVVMDMDLVVWNGAITRPWEVAQAFYQDCLQSLS